MVPIRGRLRTTITLVVPAVILAGGLFVGGLQSTEWRWRLPLLNDISDLTALDPVRALPRTATALATLEAQRHLDSGRPYAAWETLQGYLDVSGPLGHTANLLAARAAIEWGGWARARSVLVDRSWLAEVAGGEGLYYLARSEEELANPAAAEQAYRSYLALGNSRDRGAALSRHGLVLSELGNSAEAARAFELAAAESPRIADWLQVRKLEELVKGDNPSVALTAGGLSGGSAAARMTRVLLEATALVGNDQTEQAIYRLDWEARILNAEGARAEAARLSLERARLLIAANQGAEGREILRRIAADPGVPGDRRLEAANRLGSERDRTVGEELARADAFEAASRPGLAAAALRTALEAGAADGGAQRLRLAQLLYEERDFGPARSAFQRAAELLEDREERAYAELHAARSLFRAGGSTRAQQSQRQTALSEISRVVERYDGTAAAGTALFILGDEAPTTQLGLAYYRQAAEVTHSPDAREALFRVGDRSLRLKDTAGAIRTWEKYVARYPSGEPTARVAYEAGRLQEAAGRRTEARAMFTAATVADPTAYWAMRAAERLSVDVLHSIKGEPRPWVGLASEPAEAAAVLSRLDALDAAGLRDARAIEYQGALRAFEHKPVAMLVLAEGLVDRGEPVEAIRLGRLLLAQRDGVWDDRLLRVVYPFLFRELITAEADRADIDPTLYAALVRQESTFRPAVKSWVGATGLGQIMPATGQWLAPSIGIRSYDHSLLEIPEVNVRMGTKYFSDLLKRYNGAADLALAGYNAGPGRADRWRSQFGYGRDTDAFRAAIPFDETRNYVMIVLRNAAIYESLYSGTPRGARASRN